LKEAMLWIKLETKMFIALVAMFNYHVIKAFLFVSSSAVFISIVKLFEREPFPGRNINNFEFYRIAFNNPFVIARGTLRYFGIETTTAKSIV
jgi:hypothetical protein